MKLIIIGSDSFIAQKFLAYFNSKTIKGISRITPLTEKEIQVKDLFMIDDFEFIEGEVVINFAAIVHQTSIKDPNIYNEVNNKLSVLNAKKSKQAGIKLYIQMSTVAVYGNVSEISISTPYNPLNPYGNSKLKADEELLAMQDDHFKVAIIRPPMVYGGGKAPGNMMRLIKLTDKGIHLPFKGVDNKRDFINVHNLIQYIEIIARKHMSGIHLITDQEAVSTEYLLNTISHYLGKKIPMIKIPNFGLSLLKKFRPNEFNKLFGTLRIETNFPYEDLIKRYSVEDGISEMVEWYKSNRNKA